MELLTQIGAGLSVLLAVYLFIALLFPEKLQ